ncbi:uncharacterized protein MONBRDRAFT_10958 [Monosiga brevicollis MX1]|uniref:Uncharacterized protein n=1 Tax=Monosiga brevicollis TaxID=81824 RepID=A9V7S1_MONBE|nr:uncharacterized protein MONBRDRAFT_10958 [Monosiga brevicollis MX1]EDQ86423.1 predicted protein [Monosiga brevicollis MX1]|eukprot:XP_001748813.1 hypothetical protein [Monosiga brevicollis MX1]
MAVATATATELVLPNCRLVEAWRQSDQALSPQQAQDAVRQVTRRLGEIDPMLAHMLAANLVRNERRNFINLRFRRGRFKLLFRRRLPEQRGFICFFLCDNFQPMVEVCVLDPARGELPMWADVPRDELHAALATFQQQHLQTSQHPLSFLTAPHPDAPRYPSLDALMAAPAASQPDARFSVFIDIGLAALRLHIKLLQLVSLSDVQTASSMAHTVPLERLRRQLRGLNPLLGHMVFTREVVQIQPRFLATVFVQELEGDVYEFHLSEKIEPYVIIIVINPYAGKLAWLNRQQVACLERSIDAFKRKYGIHAEAYHYTSLRERQATDAFVRAGHAPRTSKAHSSDFHLKMRVATAMLRDRLPALSLFDLDKARREVEPITYNFSRDNVGWPDIKAVLLTEVDGNGPDCADGKNDDPQKQESGYHFELPRMEKEMLKTGRRMSIEERPEADSDEVQGR